MSPVAGSPREGRAVDVRSHADVPDVLVVGGGPAGSTTAGLLAALGWTVHLLDRSHFPRPKPCGECLNPGAVAALERLGLLDAVVQAGPAVLDGWDLQTPSGPLARGRFGAGGGYALALPREKLDQVLLEAARSRGVVVQEGARVESVRPGGRSVLPSAVVREEGRPPRTVQARVIVGADGLRSRVVRSLGAIRRPPRIRKVSFTARIKGQGPPPNIGRLLLSDAGTVGLAPVESGPEPSAWNVTVVLQAPAAGGPPPGDPKALILTAVKNAVPLWDREPEIVGGPWASGPFDWPTRRITAPGVVLVGDAAGYFDPLTGQGIYRALRTAEWASEAIDSGLRRDRISEEELAGYGRRVRRELRWSRAVQRGVEAILSRRRFREVALGRLAATPDSLDRLLRVTGDVSPAGALLSPRWWLPLLWRAGAPPTETPIADRR